MGSGKSAIARKLAKALNLSFIDTDNFVEEKYNQKISEIFKVDGEHTFRTYESNILKQVSSNQVVSTGGGIVERAENLNTMKKNGTVIYLQTTFDEIVRRLQNDQSRPLWRDNLKDRKSLYERRILLYERNANYTICTNNKSVDDLVDEIKKLLKKECIYPFNKDS